MWVTAAFCYVMCVLYGSPYHQPQHTHTAHTAPSRPATPPHQSHTISLSNDALWVDTTWPCHSQSSRLHPPLIRGRLCTLDFTSCSTMTPSLLRATNASSDGDSGAARSLHKQLLCTQLTPLPPSTSCTVTSTTTAALASTASKKRKAMDDSDSSHSANKKVTSPTHPPTPPPYSMRSRLRRSTSNSSTASTASDFSSSSPSSPSSPASPLSPASATRGELQTAVVHSFSSHGYCAYPLSLYHDPAKGHCVRSTAAIPRHSLICEYAGELLTGHQAHTRERQYALDEALGCYMFYFGWSGSEWCIDSTRVPLDDPEQLRWGYGRYINHGRVGANLYGRVIGVQGRPHLCFFAKRAIRSSEELLIDYGDRSRESRQAFPWLKS